MFDVKVSASTPAELTAAIVALAAVMQNAPVPVPTAPPQQPAPVVLAPVVAQAPAPAPATIPTAVPTAAPSYTLDQISLAAGTFANDPANREKVLALLQKFGVPTLIALPPEHYGAFATELRALGAKL